MSHVAFVYPAFQDASAERNVLPTAGGLAGRGHEVDVVLFERWSGTMPEGTRPIALDDWQGVSRSRLARVAPSLLTRFPVAAPALLRRGAALRVRRLAGYFERERPDVVFANFPKAEYAAYFAARMASPAPPVVPVLHTAAPPGSTDAGRRRYVWRATDRMVAVSRGAAQMASAVLGVPEDNISVIYNPAGTVRNLDRLVKEAPDHPWFRDGGPPVVLGAGRLAREKDFGVLIEAFHRVQSEYPSRPPPAPPASGRGEEERRPPKSPLPRGGEGQGEGVDGTDPPRPGTVGKCSRSAGRSHRSHDPGRRALLNAVAERRSESA